MAQRIKLEQLTPVAFAPFGTVIQNPTLAPADTPPNLLTKSVEANQGSATKYLNVTYMVNLYGGTPSGQREEGSMNMFACNPRKLRPATGSSAPNSSGQGDDESPPVSLRRAGLSSSHQISSKANRREYMFPVEVLERHPYTYQTFVPMGLAADNDDTAYLIIVAPTQIWMTDELVNPPDLAKVRAFLAHGRQAVTYHTGTWHAPMVVVGKSAIDFVVCQWSNGVAHEDCEEYSLPKDEVPTVILDLEVDDANLYESAWSKSESSKF